MKIFFSAANEIHGWHGARIDSVLQSEGQNASGKNSLPLSRPLRACVQLAKEPLLPEELLDCWRLDSQDLV